MLMPALVSSMLMPSYAPASWIRVRVRVPTFFFPYKGGLHWCLSYFIREFTSTPWIQESKAFAICKTCNKMVKITVKTISNKEDV
jgi:hypothetical protein